MPQFPNITDIALLKIIYLQLAPVTFRFSFAAYLPYRLDLG